MTRCVFGACVIEAVVGSYLLINIRENKINMVGRLAANIHSHNNIIPHSHLKTKLLPVKTIVNAAEEAKASDTLAIDISKISDVATTLVITSGRSDRHVQGIANRIIETLAKEGREPTLIEGFDKAHWILLDYDDTVVHVFYEPMRPHYDLEGLWVR